MHRIGEWLNDPADPARVLFVQGANPVVMCPDQHAVLDAFARDDVFTVVHDQVMTDTARYADVVLPATTHYEADDLAGSYGSFAILPVNAVIDRVGESRTNDEVAAALGARLSVDLTAPISGIDRESLITDGGDLGPRVVRDRTVQFVDSSPTDGKARLAQPEVPSYHPIESAYPLALITPASSKLINSMFGEFQSPDPVIRLNPGDARSRSLAPGDQVRVFNDLGSLDLGCVIDADLRPGLVAMPKGIWLRRYGAQNVGINALIPATADDLAGGACFNDARVEVERLA